MKTREQQVAEITKHLVEGGWSSIYQFVDDNLQDWILETEEDIEEQKKLKKTNEKTKTQ